MELLILSILISIIPFIFLAGMLNDIYFRCKLKRTLFKKNYGIVNLVSKDGKSITKMIKNFDGDIITIKDKGWIIEPNKIYLENKISQPISPEHIKFISGVPSIFLDNETLYALTFHKDDVKIHPAEIFAPVQAYIITKEAELLRWKKTMTIGLIVLISLLAVSVYFSYANNDFLQNTVKPQLAEIITKLNTT